MEKNEIEYEIKRFKQSTRPLIIDLKNGKYSLITDKKAIIKIEGANLVINSSKIKLEDILRVRVKD